MYSTVKSATRLVSRPNQTDGLVEWKAGLCQIQRLCCRFSLANSHSFANRNYGTYEYQEGDSNVNDEGAVRRVGMLHELMKLSLPGWFDVSRVYEQNMLRVERGRRMLEEVQRLHLHLEPSIRLVRRARASKLSAIAISTQ